MWCVRGVSRRRRSKHQVTEEQPSEIHMFMYNSIMNVCKSCILQNSYTQVRRSIMRHARIICIIFCHRYTTYGYMGQWGRHSVWCEKEMFVCVYNRWVCLCFDMITIRAFTSMTRYMHVLCVTLPPVYPF
jgi:hypothetical protein